MITTAEAHLVRAARQGDVAAFEALLRREYRSGFRLAFGMLHDSQEAEDAVQEAAFRAWRRIGNLRHDAPLGPWFLGIVANQCGTVKRARWWTVIRLWNAPTDWKADAADASGLALRGALARLKYDQRLVLVLRYYIDMPYEGIASLLGISAKAARRRVERALMNLRSTLGDEEFV